MRVLVLGIALATGLTGCVERTRPYRFGSPMLAGADVPPEPFPDAPTQGSNRARVREVSAPTIREVSATAADEITREAAARGTTFAKLATPHRTGGEVRAVHTLDDLRTLVGQRDKRDPVAVVLAWSRELGGPVPAEDAPALLAWAEAGQRLGARSELPSPGDLLVFDRATSDGPADLVALAIARDPRGVVELVYLGNGIVRRGFLDPSRPTLRRDAAGDIVNTILRHGRRPPPKGTRYLAGELLAHVVRAR